MTDDSKPTLLISPPRPSLGQFARTFASEFLTAMSGGLSVPAAFFAAYSTNDIAKGVFGITALSCVIFSAYRLWRKERCAVIDLTEAVNLANSEINTIELLFDDSDPAFVKDKPFLHKALYPQSRRWFIAIRNPSLKRSIDMVSVRALESHFVSSSIAVIWREINGRSEKEPQVFFKPMLEPMATDYFEILGMDGKPPDNPNDILARTNFFTLEARAQNAPAVRITLKYEPTTPPTIVRI